MPDEGDESETKADRLVAHSKLQGLARRGGRARIADGREGGRVEGRGQKEGGSGRGARRREGGTEV